VSDSGGGALDPALSGQSVPGAAISPDGTAAVTGVTPDDPAAPDLDTEGPQPGEESNFDAKQSDSNDTSEETR